MNEENKNLLDFGLTEEEIEQLEKSSSDVACEGGAEGWAG